MKKDNTVITNLKGVRVLFVGPYPPPFGGISQHIDTLLPDLVKADADDIAVVTFGRKNTIERINGITVYRFNIKYNIWRIFSLLKFPLIAIVIKEFRGQGLSQYFIIREVIKALIVDTVVTKHKSNVLSNYMATASLELLPLNKYWSGSKGILLTVYGEIFEDPFTIKHKNIINKLLLIPDYVLSSSCHCANSFKRIGNKRQIEPVFIGVELDDFIDKEKANRFRESHGIQRDKLLVFFMGRMNQDMGLDIVLDTAEALLDSEVKVHLLIAGATGLLSSRAHDLAKQYPERVIVLENISSQQKREFYAAADILVAPSFNERACMGVSIKEAMAASLPVVAGAGGGIPEAVEDGVTGLLVPVSTSGSIDGAKYLVALRKLVIDSELRERFGNAGRKRAENIFSHNITNHRYAEMIRTSVKLKL